MTSGSVLSRSRRAVPAHAGRRASAGRENPGGAVDAATPSAARMYDYMLGGKDNYAPDRDLADRALLAAPVLSRLVRVNRAFLRQATRHLAGQAGIRQFLDIGCGLPAGDDVGQTVRTAAPGSRVVYVDNDPMVLSHARALLAVDGDTDAVAADLRDPAGIVRHPEVTALIDFSEPVGVLLLSVLHSLTDADDPRGIVARLLAGLPPGSHVVVSHAERTPGLDAVAELYQEADVPFAPRTREEIAALSAGLEPVSADPALPLPGHGRRINAEVPLIGSIGRKPA
ncbi:SAM-dependent methyltransferase [Spirillospora sp. NBC_01491]|uniref:SAM-dependent methyltransferase n=1 Tax=Spirillospora sp. NBC_01491 TaxID=2976007 RepID=UPI002E35C334|nr:SAM-dependent methyltransferase [Spirillospora sp. NBC_01491]